MHVHMKKYPSILVSSEAFQDYLKVTLSRERNSLTARSVVDLTATPDQIFNWYYAQDPVDEERHFRSMRLFDDNENLIVDNFVAELETEASRALTYETAGTNLIAQTAFPEFFENKDKPALVSVIESIVTRNPEIYEGQEMPLSNLEIMIQCYEQLYQGQYSSEDLDILMHAVDMLAYSSTFNEGVVAAVKEKSAAGETIDIGEINTMHTMQRSERQKLLGDLSKQFISLVAEKADDTYKETGEFEAARIHLSSLMRLGSYAFGPTPRGRPFEESAALFPAFNIMLDAAKQYFTGPDCLQRRFKNDPQIRGLLHEYMWLLDFNLLLRAEADGLVHVGLANGSQNAPKVNFPTKNRGLDFMISVLGASNGWESYGVQLKSRANPRHSKVYHPAIRQIKEPNFQDINPYSLKSKLEKYAAFLNQAETDGAFVSGIEPVKRLVLKSVLSEYSFINDTKDHLFTPEAIKSVHEINNVAAVVMGATVGRPLNRAQRRQQEKQKRRKNHH